MWGRTPNILDQVLVVFEFDFADFVVLLFVFAVDLVGEDEFEWGFVSEDGAVLLVGLQGGGAYIRRLDGEGVVKHSLRILANPVVAVQLEDFTRSKHEIYN